MVSPQIRQLRLFLVFFLSLSKLPFAIVHHQSLQTREQWTADHVPSPATNPKACGLNATGRICDPDLLLPAADRQKIEQVLESASTKTKLQCPDGKNHSYQVAVLVVKSIASSEWVGIFGPALLGGNKELTGEKFAHSVGDLWGVGDAGCDNGALLFLSIDDRMFYLKTAKQTREMLSDSEATRILKNMKPLLRSGETAAAILRGTNEIMDALEGNSIPVYHTWLDYFTWTLIGFAICVNLPQLILLFCFLVTILLAALLWPCAKAADAISSCWRRLRVSRGAENDLQRVQKEMEKDEFDQSMCPICLENFSENDAGVIALSCKHRFHKSCIEEWITAHESCPLCRADVAEDVALADADKEKSQHYQRRLRFYLSRLAARHPRTFTTTSSPMYSPGESGMYYVYVPHYSYVDSLSSSFSSATSSMSSGVGGLGGGGGGFGGGGFGGGGGAGGGW